MTPRPAAAPSEMELTHASGDYPHAGGQARVLRQFPARQFPASQFQASQFQGSQCPVSRGEELAAPGAGLVLPPWPGSVKTARDFTASMLRRWGMPVLSDEAELVVSELVTNALRHGLRGAAPARPGDVGPGGRSGYRIRLRLLAQPPCLMCMVADPSREIPLRQHVGPDAETGRGLHVIESCSSQWGWHLLDDGGKVVWALLEP